MRVIRYVIGSLLVVQLLGCSHGLEVRNLSKYQSSSLNTLSKDLSIGIITANTNQDGQLLVTGAAQALNGYVGRIVYPYAANMAHDVDVISKITVRTDHSGSGYNFWINFPGFLVWAPAWNGYLYEPTYDIDVNMMSAVDNAPIDSFTIPIKLDVRHAEFDRTWIELSWLEWGAIAFIGGLYSMQYDPDVTPLVETAVQKPIGDFIAQEIAQRLGTSRHYDALVQRRLERKKALQKEASIRPAQPRSRE